MSCIPSTPLESAAYGLNWQATYLRRAAEIANAVAQFSSERKSQDPEGDQAACAGANLFLASYLGFLADVAEEDAGAAKGGAQ